MSYVKIEDGIFRNPKVVSVSSSAKLIYVASICYCGASLTDGFVPTNAARMLSADAGVTYSPKVIGELVGAGLWHEVDGGYNVHDYLTYNESSAKVQEKKEAARIRMGKRRSPEVPPNRPRTSPEVQEPTTTTTTTTHLQADEDIPPSPKTALKNGGLSAVQEARFNRWYRSYPRKVSKAEAVKAWAKITPAPTDELTERMIAKVEEWAGSDEWADPQYIPHPSTWLNAGRWDDGPPTSRKSPNGSMTMHYGGRDGTPGRDGRTDAERGYRLDPGPKGWSANEMAMRAIDLDRMERSGT